MDETTPTSETWDTKKNGDQTRLYLGIVDNRNSYQRRVQYEPRYHQNRQIDKFFREHYMPKRNTYHSREDFFWAHQEDDETLEEH